MRMTVWIRHSKLFVLECRVLARSLMPSLATRKLALLGAVAWVVLGAVAALLIARRNPPRLPGADSLVTLMVFFAAVALAIAIASAARLLRRPELTALWRLAPLSPTFVTLLPLLVLLTAASLAVFVLAAPMFWLVLVVDRTEFVTLAVVAGLVAAWATLATLAAVATLSVSRGPDKAASMAQMMITPVIVAFGFVMRWTSTHRNLIDGPTVLLFVFASAALLPLTLRSVSRLWLQGLSAITPPRRSPPVHWGRISWGRMLLRTPAPLTIAVALPLIAVSGTQRWAPLSIFLVAVPSIAMFHLMRWEDLCPERQQLAPRAKALKLDMFWKVGMPAVAISSAAVLALAIQQPRLMLLLAGIVVGALSIFVQQPRARGVIQLGVIAFGAAVGISLS